MFVMKVCFATIFIKILLKTNDFNMLRCYVVLKNRKETINITDFSFIKKGNARSTNILKYKLNVIDLTVQDEKSIIILKELMQKNTDDNFYFSLHLFGWEFSRCRAIEAYYTALENCFSYYLYTIKYSSIIYND